MGKQSDIFANGEGQQWLSRNIAKLPVDNDPVLLALEKTGIRPFFTLEIGCANGWRLFELRKRYRSICDGIDPGIATRQQPIEMVSLHYGTADNLSFNDGVFDTVIYGFCLYLCDPEDYFKIAAEGDRVLANGGCIIVYDFTSDSPYKMPYKHNPKLFSHHMKFEQLWLYHPSYHLVHSSEQSTAGTAVRILRKDSNHAFPISADS